MEELARNTTDTVANLLARDNALAESAKGCGTNQEFLKVIMAQVFGGLGAIAANGFEQYKERLAILESLTGELQQLAREGRVPPTGGQPTGPDCRGCLGSAGPGGLGNCNFSKQFAVDPNVPCTATSQIDWDAMRRNMPPIAWQTPSAPAGGKPFVCNTQLLGAAGSFVRSVPGASLQVSSQPARADNRSCYGMAGFPRMVSTDGSVPGGNRHTQAPSPSAMPDKPIFHCLSCPPGMASANGDVFRDDCTIPSLHAAGAQVPGEPDLWQQWRARNGPHATTAGMTMPNGVASTLANNGSSDRRAFPDKVGISREQQLDGAHNGGAWRAAIRNSLVSRAPETGRLLRISEASEDAAATCTLAPTDEQMADVYTAAAVYTVATACAYVHAYVGRRLYAGHHVHGSGRTLR